MNNPFLFFLVTGLLCSFHLTAQIDLQLQWVADNQTNKGGSNYFTESPRVLADSDGGVFYVGSTYHPGPITGVIVVHYDSSGVALWRDTLDDTSVDTQRDALLSPDGKLIIAVSSFSPFGFGAWFYMIKYDEYGQREWQNLGNTPGDFRTIKDVEINANGDLYFLSSYTNNTQDSFWLETNKINGQTGELIWTEQLLSEEGQPYRLLQCKLLDDRLVSVALRGPHYIIHQTTLDGIAMATAENNYTSEAEFNDWMHIDEEGNIYLGKNFGGYQTAKVSIEGDTIWSYRKEIPDAGGSQLVDFEIDPAQNLYTAGSIKDGDKYRLLITKFTPQGQIIWERFFPMEQDFAYCGVYKVKLYENQLWVVGECGIEGDTYRTYLLAAYEESGALIGQDLYKDPVLPKGAATSVSKKGKNVFIAGYSYSVNDLNVKFQKILKYKIDQKTTTSIPLAATTGLLLYPNPTKETLTAILDGDQKKDGQFLLYNNLGSLLKSQDYQTTAGRNSVSFNLAGFAPGLYWLVFSGNDGTQIGQRLVIQ